MDLTTHYLGMKLKSPIVPSASPLSEEIGNIRKMEDAGAGAVVLHSLFEEQIAQESLDLDHFTTKGTESFAESLTYFPEPGEYRLGPEEYLNHIRKAKEAVKIPVIASLNGTSEGGWTDYAARMEEAGADALELNIYYIPTDPALSAEKVENTYVEIVKSVRSTVRIPLAVKISPFFSNLAYTAGRLDRAGANALVLFNRFYQPDIDLDDLEVRTHVLLSAPQAMRLPLRWIAILHGRIKADLAATGGIHTAEDCLKMLMAGAKTTMLCSVLLKKGIDQIREIEMGMRKWMEGHEYVSVEQMQGSMSQRSVEDPAAFERAQYMRALAGYRA
ncbi:MAG: dihydroorotate dehydrogenase-like protein [Candidatus Eisenbacteria bacterium]|nr:dihydroorotate dehydrogenase-like protein [Candidatus Eisenbacteria bacterium]